ncbi:helix-turn-helix transcriptional regulator [Streptomyces sp. ME02-8801-2C]|uniref:helix-turn-helix domain-containing protein n=1 Tax=Streptomyces sp. ME02-8801-2C TaxID=3028680 RepID=UPI0029A967D8|nr:helix-turn-helix transcriptional regulator [Streptomyces sp. ME02-8801-2C]MDX3455022.1 helix-turn-helix transcriptional regulator [Streptomyces sp. ME02-8801-2C]
MRDLPDDNTWITEGRRAIGARIRAERERQNLTQEQLILAARIDRVTLWRVESGQESTLSTLLRIARALEVSLGELTG